MKKKIAIIVLFFFIIIYFLSSYSFAYTDVSVEQDIYYYSQYEIDFVRKRISNFSDLSAFISFINNKFSLNINVADARYFAIVPNSANAARMNLYLYKLSNVDNTVVPNYNYYGVDIEGFTLTSCIRVTFDETILDDSGVYSVNTNFTNITVPQHYYYMRSYFLFGNNDNTAILQNIEDNIEDNTNAIKENTNVSQETQNFVKSDNEVDDNTINDFTNDINVDTVDSTASTNIFEMFGIIDSQDNEQTTEIPIHFTFLNLDISFTINRYLTNQFLTRVFGFGPNLFISTAVRLIWTYFIFIFIVKNILSLIDKIKAGEIDKINTKNVLVDVL